MVPTWMTPKQEKPLRAQPSAWGSGPAWWRRQARRPAGILGWVRCQLMARRNRERSAWVVSLLDLQPGDRVLEIGFGPGLGIERASELAGRGFVAGIDHSEVMLRQARKRNAAAVRAGRVELRLAGMTSIPYPDGSFAKLFAINCFQFSPDPAATLREFRRVLKPGGLAAIAIQPRSPGATEETVRQFGASLSEALAAAGFANVRVEIKPLKEISAVCALGNAPQ